MAASHHNSLYHSFYFTNAFIVVSSGQLTALFGLVKSL